MGEIRFNGGHFAKIPRSAREHIFGFGGRVGTNTKKWPVHYVRMPFLGNPRPKGFCGPRHSTSTRIICVYCRVCIDGVDSEYVIKTYIRIPSVTRRPRSCSADSAAQQTPLVSAAQWTGLLSGLRCSADCDAQRTEQCRLVSNVVR